MAFSDIIAKLANESPILNEQEKQEVYLQAKELERAASLVATMVIPGGATLKLDGLVTTNASVANAEIVDAKITDADITDATITNATITNATLDSVSAGNGHVILGTGGVDIIEGGAGWITFYADNGTTVRATLATDTGGFQISGEIAGEDILIRSTMTNLDSPYIGWMEDPVNANKSLMEVTSGTKGSKVFIHGGSEGSQLDVCGTAADSSGRITLYGEGDTSQATFIRVYESSRTPPAPSGDAAHIYVKGGKLVVTDGNGYFTLNMNAGSTQSWVYSATAP